MIVTTIDPQHAIRIPEPFREALRPGQRVALSIDSQGRLIVMPTEQLESTLQDTFGIWSDRTEAHVDSIAWMDAIRRGQRLDAVSVVEDEDP